MFVSVSLSLRCWLPAGWLAQGQINTSVHESCSPHTPKTIAGGLCAGQPGLLNSQSAYTACFLSATEMAGDVFQSRVSKEKALPALCTKFRAHCETKFHALAWKWTRKQCHGVISNQQIEDRRHYTADRVGLQRERCLIWAWVRCKQEMSCLLPKKMLKKCTGRTLRREQRGK